MCGIVGYVGPRQATPIVVDGLKRLEYRGYDSAGVAALQNGRIALRRSVGKLTNLINALEVDPLSGHIGMGHSYLTRREPSVLPTRRSPPAPGGHGGLVGALR